jgi:hypothetical protein
MMTKAHQALFATIHSDYSTYDVNKFNKLLDERYSNILGEDNEWNPTPAKIKDIIHKQVKFINNKTEVEDSSNNKSSLPKEYFNGRLSFATKVHGISEASKHKENANNLETQFPKNEYLKYKAPYEITSKGQSGQNPRAFIHRSVFGTLNNNVNGTLEKENIKPEHKFVHYYDPNTSSMQKHALSDEDITQLRENHGYMDANDSDYYKNYNFNHLPEEVKKKADLYSYIKNKYPEKFKEESPSKPPIEFKNKKLTKNPIEMIHNVLTKHYDPENTPHEYKSVFRSYGGGSHSLNHALIRMEPDRDYSKKAKLLEKGIHSYEPLKHQLHVYSNIGDWDLSKDEKFVHKNEHGEHIIHTPAFISSTIKPTMAINWKESSNDEGTVKNIVHFVLPKGYRNGAYIRDMSGYEHEYEYLLNHNQYWKHLGLHSYVNGHGTKINIHTLTPHEEQPEQHPIHAWADKNAKPSRSMYSGVNDKLLKISHEVGENEYLTPEEKIGHLKHLSKMFVGLDKEYNKPEIGEENPAGYTQHLINHLANKHNINAETIPAKESEKVPAHSSFFDLPESNTVSSKIKIKNVGKAAHAITASNYLKQHEKIQELEKLQNNVNNSSEYEPEEKEALKHFTNFHKKYLSNLTAQDHAYQFGEDNYVNSSTSKVSPDNSISFHSPAMEEHIKLNKKSNLNYDTDLNQLKKHYENAKTVYAGKAKDKPYWSAIDEHYFKHYFNYANNEIQRKEEKEKNKEIINTAVKNATKNSINIEHELDVNQLPNSEATAGKPYAESYALSAAKFHKEPEKLIKDINHVLTNKQHELKPGEANQLETIKKHIAYKHGIHPESVGLPSPGKNSSINSKLIYNTANSPNLSLKEKADNLSDLYNKHGHKFSANEKAEHSIWKDYVLHKRTTAPELPQEHSQHEKHIHDIGTASYLSNEDKINKLNTLKQQMGSKKYTPAVNAFHKNWTDYLKASYGMPSDEFYKSLPNNHQAYTLNNHNQLSMYYDLASSTYHHPLKAKEHINAFKQKFGNSISNETSNYIEAWEKHNNLKEKEYNAFKNAPVTEQPKPLTINVSNSYQQHQKTLNNPNNYNNVQQLLNHVNNTILKDSYINPVEKEHAQKWKEHLEWKVKNNPSSSTTNNNEEDHTKPPGSFFSTNDDEQYVTDDFHNEMLSNKKSDKEKLITAKSAIKNSAFPGKVEHAKKWAKHLEWKINNSEDVNDHTKPPGEPTYYEHSPTINTIVKNFHSTMASPNFTDEDKLKEAKDALNYSGSLEKVKHAEKWVKHLEWKINNKDYSKPPKAPISLDKDENYTANHFHNLMVSSSISDETKLNMAHDAMAFTEYPAKKENAKRWINHLQWKLKNKPYDYTKPPEAPNEEDSGSHIVHKIALGTDSYHDKKLYLNNIINNSVNKPKIEHAKKWKAHLEWKHEGIIPEENKNNTSKPTTTTNNVSSLEEPDKLPAHLHPDTYNPDSTVLKDWHTALTKPGASDLSKHEFISKKYNPANSGDYKNNKGLPGTSEEGYKYWSDSAYKYISAWKEHLDKKLNKNPEDVSYPQYKPTDMSPKFKSLHHNLIDYVNVNDHEGGKKYLEAHLKDNYYGEDSLNKINKWKEYFDKKTGTGNSPETPSSSEDYSKPPGKPVHKSVHVFHDTMIDKEFTTDANLNYAKHIAQISPQPEKVEHANKWIKHLEWKIAQKNKPEVQIADSDIYHQFNNIKHPPTPPISANSTDIEFTNEQQEAKAFLKAHLGLAPLNSPAITTNYQDHLSIANKLHHMYSTGELKVKNQNHGPIAAGNAMKNDPDKTGALALAVAHHFIHTPSSSAVDAENKIHPSFKKYAEEYKNASGSKIPELPNDKNEPSYHFKSTVNSMMNTDQLTDLAKLKAAHVIAYTNAGKPLNQHMRDQARQWVHHLTKKVLNEHFDK